MAVMLSPTLNRSDLGWAMRDGNWLKAGEILQRMYEDQQALEFYVAGKIRESARL